jgi:hypothetical protein
VLLSHKPGVSINEIIVIIFIGTVMIIVPKWSIQLVSTSQQFSGAFKSVS